MGRVKTEGGSCFGPPTLIPPARCHQSLKFRAFFGLQESLHLDHRETGLCRCMCVCIFVRLNMRLDTCLCACVEFCVWRCPRVDPSVRGGVCVSRSVRTRLYVYTGWLGALGPFIMGFFSMCCRKPKKHEHLQVFGPLVMTNALPLLPFSPFPHPHLTTCDKTQGVCPLHTTDTQHCLMSPNLFHHSLICHNTHVYRQAAGCSRTWAMLGSRLAL